MYPGVYVAAHGAKPAVIMADSGRTLTYRELDERSCRLARLLVANGFRRGDHVALLTDNDPRVFEVYWAALRSGLYITLVNAHLAPAEVAYIVRDCGAAALVASAALRELAEQVAADIPQVRVRLAFGGPVAGYEPYEEALAAHPPTPLPDQPRGADMMYSSGTTGRPKGVQFPLPDRQVHEPGDGVLAAFGPRFDVDSVYLSPAPIYHAAPLRFCGVVHATGGTVVLMRRFDAEATLAAIAEYRVTHSQFVPTMLVRMLKLPADVRARYDVSTMRLAVHAAAPCPVEVKQAMIDWWGPVFLEYYAASENNGVTIIDTAEWLRKPGSVGQAKQGTLRICGSNGELLPPGEIGTVYFERDELPFRYLNDPAKTAEAQHPAHPTWTTTGDVGYLDEDQYLFLTDRRAFTIISGGVNIYPQEVENSLTPHPKVLDAAVIGVPDAEMGEAVKAIVQVVPGAVAGPELARELQDYLRGRIARFKCPRTIEFVDELPRTPTGKLVKHELRNRFS